MDSVALIITSIATLVGEIAVLLATILPVKKENKKIAKENEKIANGQKCQLRSEMLRIYYHNADNGKIRQYEYENFVFLYEAYKSLDGNSFIDKIYSEIQSWEVIT